MGRRRADRRKPTRPVRARGVRPRVRLVDRRHGGFLYDLPGIRPGVGEWCPVGRPGLRHHLAGSRAGDLRPRPGLPGLRRMTGDLPGAEDAPTTGGRQLISIVCPVFNEEAAVPLFYRRLREALGPLRHAYDFELIFTNNRSTDRTLEVVSGLRQADPTVQVLTFSRNFGYQASVLAGLRHAAGDAMVVIDVDCEDPPEMIPKFVAEWEKGFDVVYGLRGKR